MKAEDADTIVTANHKRVWFTLTEINEKLLENHPGEVLVLEVANDGQLIDAYVGNQDGTKKALTFREATKGTGE
jgi:hypothetical protein